MTKKTPEQRRGELLLKLQKAEDEIRRARTRRLIETGAMMGETGERMKALDPESRATLLKQIDLAIKKLAEQKREGEGQ